MLIYSFISQSFLISIVIDEGICFVLVPKLFLVMPYI